MEAETPLDAAFAAMEAAPGDEAARLRFHERLMDAELYVLLEDEEADGRLRPRVFDLEEGRFVLAFDLDARLAAFLDAPAPYAAMAGRRLAQGLAGQGVGVALNPGVAPAQTLLPAEAVDWLAEMAAEAVEAAAVRPVAVRPPAETTAALAAALDAKLSAMAGRIEAAWLAELETEDGGRRPTLAVAGAAEAAQPGIAAAVAEAVRFSGAEAGGLDVTFLGPGSPARAAFERVGLRFDPPAAAAEPARATQAPGSDPDRPPILR